LTVAQVKQKDAPAPRTGAQALSLLAIPINAAILKVLAAGPRSLFDLRREVDSPPQTTMRAYLRELTRTGVVEKRRRNEFPGNVEYELARSGRELLVVAGIVADWLEKSPVSPLAFGSGAARSAIKALVEGWSTTMIGVLAARPVSLTELDSIIASVSYPSLERRLGAMRQECLIEPLSSQGRGTPYGATEWLRRATAPLTASARWERCNAGDEAPPIDSWDVEAAFLLSLPLLCLPPTVSGDFRLAVQLEEDGRSAPAGVVASIREGRVEACESRLERQVDAWALGSCDAWLAAVIEGDSCDMTFGGSDGAAQKAIEALHDTLFGSATSPLVLA
jgi:DNA-binding HxlR family transcriptional regulator